MFPVAVLAVCSVLLTLEGIWFKLLIRHVITNAHGIVLGRV